jgi:hypothetical protein
MFAPSLSQRQVTPPPPPPAVSSRDQVKLGSGERARSGPECGEGRTEQTEQHFRTFSPLGSVLSGRDMGGARRLKLCACHAAREDGRVGQTAGEDSAGRGRQGRSGWKMRGSGRGRRPWGDAVSRVWWM